MSLLSDKELDDYCMQALNVPLMGISQLVSMVILHFNVSDNEADKLVLAWLLKLVTKCEAQHAKDQKRIEQVFDWVEDNHGYCPGTMEYMAINQNGWQKFKSKYLAKIKEE